ncbi:hypothetical protein [Aestuariivirga sp.]|uniref:hypothetical protein n=1 Tax=Aestuariivirga sp. TaxID=2650926 RepID=UPI003918BAA4
MRLEGRDETCLAHLLQRRKGDHAALDILCNGPDGKFLSGVGMIAEGSGDQDRIAEALAYQTAHHLE